MRIKIKLKESNGILGKRVWPSANPMYQKHLDIFGEPDTEIERKLYLQLHKHFNTTSAWVKDNEPPLDAESVKALKSILSSGEYAEDFRKCNNPQGTMLRGMFVPLEWVRQNAPGALEAMSSDTGVIDYNKPFPTNFTYKSQGKYGGVSSWTPNKRVARIFAANRTPGGEINCVLYAKCDSGLFMSTEPFAKYKGGEYKNDHGIKRLNPARSEQEFLLFGECQVVAIQLRGPRKNEESKMKLTKEQIQQIIKQEIKEAYRDYDPEDEFTDSRTKSGGTSASSGGFRGYTDTEGPLPSRSHAAGGYSSHTGRLGDEQHDGSYEIPKFKVPSNLTPKQKKDFNIAMDIIQNTYDKYGGGPAVIKALNNAVKYGLDYDAAQMANRAYAEQMKENDMKLTQEELQHIIKEEFASVMDEKKGSKRQRKKTKKDACYRKVKARYKVWPSAYASGALVKCRKVGAKNWGNKSESLNESEDDFEPHMMYDPKTGKSEMANKKEDHEKLAAKGYIHVDPDKLRDILDDEGGAAGLEPLVKGTKSSDKEVKSALKDMPDVGKHNKGDYIKDDDKEVEIVKEYFMNEATYDDGSPVEEGFEFYENINEAELEEAEYRGRKVKLNKPTRGDVKKFKVYVKDPKTGNVKKVNFGHGGTSAKRKGEKTMKIRKSNPKARKNFRARHNCASPGPKTKARYWSCKKW